MRNKWIINDDGRSGKRYEKKTAKFLKGQLQSGSGSKDKKGDIILNRLILELKSTVSASFSLKKEYLQKIKKAAVEQDKIPVLLFAFVNGNGESIEEWACFPSYFLKELYEKYERNMDSY